MPGNIENKSEETACKITGLTQSQKCAIRHSWNIVIKDAETNGVELLVRLFKESPRTKGYFVKFRDLNDDELREQENVKAHACQVIGAVTKLVNNLDNTSVLVSSVQTLARGHKKLGVTSADFKVVLSVLQNLLKDGLAEKFNDVIEQSWRICCEVIWMVVESEMNNKSEEH